MKNKEYNNRKYVRDSNSTDKNTYLIYRRHNYLQTLFLSFKFATSETKEILLQEPMRFWWAY